MPLFDAVNVLHYDKKLKQIFLSGKSSFLSESLLIVTILLKVLLIESNIDWPRWMSWVVRGFFLAKMTFLIIL